MPTSGRLADRLRSRGGGGRPLRWAGRCAAVALVAAFGAATAAADPDGTRPRIDIAQAADSLLVQDIQFLLTDLGWDVGPADGILGDRTRLAILEAQRRYGYAPADGAVSAALRDFLESLGTAEPPDAVPVAPVVAAPIAPPPGDTDGTAAVEDAAASEPTRRADATDTAETTLVGSRWSVADSTGAMLTLALQADGRVAGPTAGDRWTWSADGGTITFAYESGIGDWARREGVVVDRDSMRGGGESSRGTTWTWTARRLP